MQHVKVLVRFLSSGQRGVDPIFSGQRKLWSNEISKEGESKTVGRTVVNAQNLNEPIERTFENKRYNRCTSFGSEKFEFRKQLT